MSDFESSSDSELPGPVTVTLTSKSTTKRPRSESVLASTSAESHDQAVSGVLGLRTPSPPSILATKNAYTSPDRLRLREALMRGGEMEFKVVEKCKMFVIACRVFINDIHMPIN